MVNDHWDSSLGYRTMWCDGNEIPVRWIDWHMCPETTDTPRSTDPDTTRTVTHNTVTKDPRTTDTKTTDTRTTDNGDCCERDDLYTWYGVHGANYCKYGVVCCPNGEWVCADDYNDVLG